MPELCLAPKHISTLRARKFAASYAIIDIASRQMSVIDMARQQMAGIHEVGLTPTW
jgi:hypothetical protein